MFCLLPSLQALWPLAVYLLCDMMRSSNSWSILSYSFIPFLLYFHPFVFPFCQHCMPDTPQYQAYQYKFTFLFLIWKKRLPLDLWLPSFPSLLMYTLSKESSNVLATRISSVVAGLALAQWERIAGSDCIRNKALMPFVQMCSHSIVRRSPPLWDKCFAKNPLFECSISLRSLGFILIFE